MRGASCGCGVRLVRGGGGGGGGGGFLFNDTATTEIYTLSLHDALPIYLSPLSKTKKLEYFKDPQPIRKKLLITQIEALQEIGRAHV